MILLAFDLGTVFMKQICRGNIFTRYAILIPKQTSKFISHVVTYYWRKQMKIISSDRGYKAEQRCIKIDMGFFF